MFAIHYFEKFSFSFVILKSRAEGEAHATGISRVKCQDLLCLRRKS